MRGSREVVALATLLALFSSQAVRADVRLPKVLTDKMVLQQGEPARLWGWADAGERVSVELADGRATTTADDAGRWSVEVATPAAGGPYELVISGNNEIHLRDILVGEVWICSGQSNMQWSVAASDNAKAEIAAAHWPKIRLLSVQRTVAAEPQEDLTDANQNGWVTCSPETVGGFSAVAYYFGRKLHKELDVPVGLVNTSWGGTRSEAWTSQEALRAEPSLEPLLGWWQQAIDDFDASRAEQQYEQALERWEKAAAQAREAGQQPPRKPQRPSSPVGSQHRPASLYNAMLAPLTPMKIRGAIWYQGESNVSRAVQYRTLFPAMIADWRERFGQGDFPFLFVQLAPYRYGGREGLLPEQWESQLLALKEVPNTGMAVTTDIGNVADIHPTNKQEVGRRLALWALATSYGLDDLVYSGPIYRSAEVEGDAIRIQFDHVAEGLKSRDGQPLSHFQIASAEGPFVPANATVEGTTVVVRSPDVPNPAAVRFAWDQTAEPNLVNSAGLPASPFRTDDRPLLTQDAVTP